MGNSKTNCVINGVPYYRIARSVGKQFNNNTGKWETKRKVFYGSSRAAAERKYKEYIKNNPSGIEFSENTLGMALSVWIDNIFINSDLSDGTKYLYTGAYERHLKNAPITAIKLNELTPLHLQKFYTDSTAPVSQLQSIHKLLGKFFKYATLNNIVSRDITASVDIPKASTQIRSNEIDTWSDEEIKALINAFDGSKMRFVVVLLVNTGLRISELLALEYSDFNLIDKTLSVNKQTFDKDGKIVVNPPKTSTSNRIIPLSSYVIDEFNKHLALHEAEQIQYDYSTNKVFSTFTDNYIYRSWIDKKIRKACADHCIKHHSIHAFRHTFGTNLSRVGIPIEETAKLMGHSSITVTAKYYIAANMNKQRNALEQIADLIK